MPVLGLTGGIATGKSTFARALRSHLAAECFDVDACARELLRSDPEVRRRVSGTFGEGIFLADGEPDRVRLRELVFADESRRKELEAILHPAIRTRWQELAAPYRQRQDWFCVDIPLLFETRAEAEFDRVVVVACSEATQYARLRSARGLSDEMAASILAAQLDLRAKITQAHHLIWNDSTASCLDGQAALLAGLLRSAVH